MAMVSMMFVLLLIVLGLLVGIAAAGLVLLVIGAVRRRKPQNAGKRSPTVCMVIGGILLTLALLPGVSVRRRMSPYPTTGATISGWTMRRPPRRQLTRY